MAVFKPISLWAAAEEERIMRASEEGLKSRHVNQLLAYPRSLLACPFLVHGFSEAIIFQPTFGKSNAKYEINRNRNVAEE